MANDMQPVPADVDELSRRRRSLRRGRFTPIRHASRHGDTNNAVRRGDRDASRACLALYRVVDKPGTRRAQPGETTLRSRLVLGRDVD